MVTGHAYFGGIMFITYFEGLILIPSGNFVECNFSLCLINHSTLFILITLVMGKNHKKLAASQIRFFQCMYNISLTPQWEDVTAVAQLRDEWKGFVDTLCATDGSGGPKV